MRKIIIDNERNIGEVTHQRLPFQTLTMIYMYMQSHVIRLSGDIIFNISTSTELYQFQLQISKS